MIVNVFFKQDFFFCLIKMKQFYLGCCRKTYLPNILGIIIISNKNIAIQVSSNKQQIKIRLMIIKNNNTVTIMPTITVINNTANNKSTIILRLILKKKRGKIDDDKRMI